MRIQRLVFLLSLSGFCGAPTAPTRAESLPPTGTLLRITSTGGSVQERPTALSDRFVVYERSFDSVVYDRETRAARQLTQDFQIGVAASNQHVAWQTPFSTVRFLKVWEAASGRISTIDVERSSFFQIRDFVGERLVYSNGSGDYVRMWNPASGLIEELEPDCFTTSWDATPRFVAWTCSFEKLVVLHDLESGARTEIVSPPKPNSQPVAIALADAWVVWTVESLVSSEVDLFAAPLSGGTVRTLATGLPRSSTFRLFAAGGGFAAWLDHGRMRLHDFGADATITVSDHPLARIPRLTGRYLIWLESLDTEQEVLRIRNLATGLEMADEVTDPQEFRELQANEDSLVYMGDLDRDAYLLEIDGDSDGIRDRDERRYALGDLDDPDGDGDGTPDGAEDPDSDGLESAEEIYVHRTNPTLADTDSDGLEDALELFEVGTDPLSPDTDGDAISDSLDPCPLDPLNDADGDGVCESEDNCPATANPDQSDLDRDGAGDPCDPDVDGDGVPNDGDFCPFHPDADQADFDGDGVGDACDADRDGDGVADAGDACMPTEPGAVADSEGCSIAQRCPCENDWQSRGDQLRCVARVAGEFQRTGLIRGAERGRILAAASRRFCGEPAAP